MAYSVVLLIWTRWLARNIPHKRDFRLDEYTFFPFNAEFRKIYINFETSTFEGKFLLIYCIANSVAPDQRAPIGAV